MSPPTGRRAESTVLTVFGAKGGIGKSTIASNVAAAIARDTKRSVLIMDMDVRFGDVAQSAGLNAPSSLEMSMRNTSALGLAPVSLEYHRQ